jgi:hypothetical protein
MTDNGKPGGSKCYAKIALFRGIYGQIEDGRQRF